VDGFDFEATIGLSLGDLDRTPYDADVEAGAQAVARAVFAMGGARRVTVVTREGGHDGFPTVDHLELKASWSDEGGAAWGLREDVERVAIAALHHP
jgi:hypothetical protein